MKLYHILIKTFSLEILNMNEGIVKSNKNIKILYIVSHKQSTQHTVF
jgi:hypothetical protein